jgi:ADP-ribose pyrophosphatase YjhB (NUDIX family)
MVGVIGIIRNTDSRFLVLEHTYRPGFPHGLPSGVLKRREPVENAIPREVKEETGLDVRFLRVLAVNTKEKPRRLDFWIECEFVGGEFKQSPEVRSAEFLTLNEAMRVLPPAQSGFLERHLGMIQNS